MANSVDPDQTPQNAASDLAPHSLLRPVYPSKGLIWYTDKVLSIIGKGEYSKRLTCNIVRQCLVCLLTYFPSIDADNNCEKSGDLFVLRFYGPVNPLGSYRTRSVYLTTLLLIRLSPLSG